MYDTYIPVDVLIYSHNAYNDITVNVNHSFSEMNWTSRCQQKTGFCFKTWQHGFPTVFQEKESPCGVNMSQTI